MNAGSERGDAFRAPLDADLPIDASAGTGKTYALTTLVARLIAEEDRRIDELLVVTFTVAAAGELRARVRRTLHEARRTAAGADAQGGDDDQAPRLREAWRRANVTDEQARERLVRALRDIDRATITTIHGFCQQALNEFALPAGIPFVFKVSGDDALAVGDAVRDFWRRRMVDEPIPLLEYAKSKGFVPGEDAGGFFSGDNTATWVTRQYARPQEIRGVPGNLEEEEPGSRDGRSGREREAAEEDSGTSNADAPSRKKREEWLEALREAERAWADPAQRQAFLQVANPERWTVASRKGVGARGHAIIDSFDAGVAEELAPNLVGAFGIRALRKGLYKVGAQKIDPPPSAPLFHHFERVGDLGEELGEVWLAGQRRRLLDDVRETLRHDAWIDRRLSFDSLLVELHHALVAERGPELARRISDRYPIGLIDEFQDTDRLQAEIFRTIYSDRGKPNDRNRSDEASGNEPGGDRASHDTADDGSAGGGNPSNGRLFVVGDPKQSIYRFRGADVFAYLEARDRLRKARGLFQLETNYRSVHGLIRAVGELFSHPRPFVLPGFTFEPSKAPERERAKLVVDDNDDGDAARRPGSDPGPLPPVDADRGRRVAGPRTGAAPFHLVLIPEGEKRNKADLTGLAARQAAGEIARLIALGREGAAALVSADRSRRTPVDGGHIAVLVRTAKQGEAVAKALGDLDIDSVELGTENIFDSEEAGALHRLLCALCLDGSEYNATPLLRGALAADLFGLDMHKLAGLRDDDDAWDRWRGLARKWADVWRRHGIATLMRRILFGGEPDCSANLLRYPDGPRRLTNYLHLSDLLHEAEIGRRPSRHGLVDWLRQAMCDSRAHDETAQLRLESDENLVKIVTVHRAKGLEFPIVFYPFAWSGQGPKTGRPTANYYDDDAEPGTPVLDLIPEDPACAREQVEERADELRLLYVALTRAEQLTVVTWAPDQGAEHAPLAWLLHGRDREREAPDEPAEALADHASYVKNLGPDEWLREVRDFAARDPSAFSVREVEAEAAPAPAASAEPAESSGPADSAEPGESAESAESAESPEPVESAEAEEELKARELGRSLRLIRQRTSYSALSTDANPRERDDGNGDASPAPETGAATSAERPAASATAVPAMPVRDRDEVDLVEPGEATVEEAPETDATREEAGPSIFSLPAGGRTGRCLHEILERLLGNPEPPALEEACKDVLSRHGFGRQWLPVARSLVANALDTPLMRPGEAGGVFRLSDLEGAVAEMEFHLPLGALRRPALGRCLKEHGYDHRIAEDDAKIEGFLHGFIDLVACHDRRWYVVDYKSNRLGLDLSAYSEEALAEAMREHGYHLQYLLYLTALHRLLRLRLPDYDYDRHMGGAFYLFLRGMRPHAPGSGVFRDRPTRECIEALDACLRDGGDGDEAEPAGVGHGGVGETARHGATAP